MKTNCPRLILLTLASIASPAWADMDIVNSSLALTQFQIVPSQGTVHFLSPITVSAFTEALNSLGELDQQFTTAGDATTSAASLTSSSAASATASALDFTASVTARTGPRANSAATSRSAFTGLFEILGASGPVSVQFIANINYIQTLSTRPHYLEADSEVALALDLDTGDQPLFVDNRLQIGPATSAFSSFDGPVSGSSTVNAGAPVAFTLRLDPEVHSEVPEPAWILLIMPALTALVLRRRLSGADRD